VEADQCGKQPPVGLGELLSDEIAPVRQPLLQLVEGGEQAVIGLVIGGLRLGKPQRYTPLLTL
jgi:hypothetical protein